MFFHQAIYDTSIIPDWFHVYCVFKIVFSANLIQRENNVSLHNPTQARGPSEGERKANNKRREVSFNNNSEHQSKIQTLQGSGGGGKLARGSRVRGGPRAGQTNRILMEITWVCFDLFSHALTIATSGELLLTDQECNKMHQEASCHMIGRARKIGDRTRMQQDAPRGKNATRTGAEQDRSRVRQDEPRGGERHTIRSRIAI